LISRPSINNLTCASVISAAPASSFGKSNVPCPGSSRLAQSTTPEPSHERHLIRLRARLQKNTKHPDRGSIFSTLATRHRSPLNERRRSVAPVRKNTRVFSLMWNIAYRTARSARSTLPSHCGSVPTATSRHTPHGKRTMSGTLLWGSATDSATSKAGNLTSTTEPPSLKGLRPAQRRPRHQRASVDVDKPFARENSRTPWPLRSNSSSHSSRSALVQRLLALAAGGLAVPDVVGDVFVMRASPVE